MGTAVVYSVDISACQYLFEQIKNVANRIRNDSYLFLRVKESSVRQ